MSMSIGNLISDYAYSYRNNLRPNLDKNSDGSWSAGEVRSFASDYERATGDTLDVDRLFDEYDTDEDGVFSSTEYERIYEDDALGLNNLTETGGAGTASPEDKTSRLSDWMESLTDRQKTSLTKATFMAETTGSLINNMFGGGGNSLSNLTYAIAQYSSAKAYNSPSYWSSAAASLFDGLM